MSPEQARGTDVDRRSDLWALGVVLYEMLAGARPFDGATVSDAIAAVLKTEPDWETLPVDTPVAIRRLLRRCLAKDARGRVDSAAAARLEIDDALSPPPDEPPLAVAPSRSSAPRRGMAFVVTTAAVAAAISGLTVWTLTRSVETSSRVSRLSVPLRGAALLTSLGSNVVALSPDGTRLVYAADGQLYQRRLDELEATALEGTEGARGPFFSPDGQWVAFWSGGLRKVAISGGPRVELARASSHRGASWEADDTSLLAQRGFGISRVPANGGPQERLIQMEEGAEATHPQGLPGGEWVLFTVRPTAAAAGDHAQVVVQSVDTGAREVLVDRGGNARYLPSGHLGHDAEVVVEAWIAEREVAGR